MVIVKPTDGATYKNFVDIMDELNITKTNLTAPAVDDDPKNIFPVLQGKNCHQNQHKKLMVQSV